MIADLRSDTVTKPTPGMLEAMMHARVGDDVFGEDPTVNELEEKCARLFGMDAAIFCPSGTMTNQIGINVLSNPYEEVICYKGSHIYKYEGGGVAGNSGLSFRLLEGDRGRINLDDILANVNADDIHLPVSSIVSLENTVNKGGGSYYTLSEIAEISEACMSRGIKMHLDGARLFNALAETGDKPGDYGKYFDTISICLSKGLGAPVGSVLLGKAEHIRKARRMRKVFGGGMRQAGYLAAAGIYALDHHVQRLTEDHQRARKIGKVLEDMHYVNNVLPVDTNILIFELAQGITTDAFLQQLDQKGVKAVAFGPREIRFVTHLDFDDGALDFTINVLSQLSF
ncbi:GntG family PLP-dependent aldolase [Fulvivirga kasyanovii]|uniref:Threonine aldolase n=1 Tax=Fulvivirga kasyanovii TaxID=396812 RepID=A0ABW9RSX4_9BACT|nr:GntG family PLP-dependent aldolase [Fulvivirga kasyanovii]MTI27279.1 threonine aldolase [Fulvivirga kasyanovii]